MANQCKHGVIQGGWCRSCTEEKEREIDNSNRQGREARQWAAEAEERNRRLDSSCYPEDFK